MAKPAIHIHVVMRTLSIKVPLTREQALSCLEAANEDNWVENFVDEYIESYEFENDVLSHVVIQDAYYDGPDRKEDLPIDVHPNQQRMEV